MLLRIAGDNAGLSEIGDDVAPPEIRDSLGPDEACTVSPSTTQRAAGDSETDTRSEANEHTAEDYVDQTQSALGHCEGWVEEAATRQRALLVCTSASASFSLTLN